MEGAILAHPVMERASTAMSLVELFVKLLHQAVSPLLPVMALIFAQQELSTEKGILALPVVTTATQMPGRALVIAASLASDMTPAALLTTSVFPVG